MTQYLTAVVNRRLPTPPSPSASLSLCPSCSRLRHPPRHGLPAGEGRTTCVLSYVARTAEHCIRAASVPLATPAHSRALAAATCGFTARV